MNIEQWSTFRKLVVDEIVFYDKGYGDDKPVLVQKEYDKLQSCLFFLDREAERMSSEHQNGDYSRVS